MDANKIDDVMRGLGRVLLVAIVPTLLFMIYAAISGLAFQSVSRGWNQPASSTITWVANPLRFILSGLMVYVVVALVMALVYAVAILVRDFVRRKR